MSTAFKAKANSSTGEGFERPPAGNHPAVLVSIIDLGHQHNDYNGQVSWDHKLYFIWELVKAKVGGTTGRNHVIGTDLTFSLNEKAKLRKFIESRTGKVLPEGAEYDIGDELGKPCLLSVTMKGEYPQVDKPAAVPDGLPIPDPQNAPQAYTLDDFKANKPVPDYGLRWYGEPLNEVIRRSWELSGREGDPPKRTKVTGQGGQQSPQPVANANNPVTTPQPDDAPALPPTTPDAAQTGRRWWVNTGEAKPVLMTEGEIEAWAASRKADPDALQIFPEDKSGGWKSAKEYGIKWQIPF